MEQISTIQLIIILTIGAALVLQFFAIKKGTFAPTVYSKNQRIRAAIIVAAPIVIYGVTVNTPFIVIFGVFLGYACFRRKTWYKRKENDS